ncbi:hypothetical protein COU61_00830 [Candidatus Pacearchaeota archaeon CG10_big_fil_rev_8_21_14_0_10_35_13]|nr:MAG: hypothetical protein COU61_00830 [Candidatus Pacearchaeota archaeon CG10_big_fil_rev_8_21_14_0_10_35_13]
MNKGVITIIILAVLLVIVGYYILTKDPVRTQNNTGTQVEIVPLEKSQQALVQKVINTNEMLNDMPDSGSIVLRFYDFKNGERIWQDGFLLSKKGLGEGEMPDILLYLHAKYINELKDDGTNLCEVIQKAKNNGDVASETELSKTKLLLRYAGMIKYRDCFGF